MEQTQRFYDFCVPYNENEKEMKAVLRELYELGYRTIAIEQIFDHTKKITTKRSGDIFPSPVQIKYFQNEFKSQLKILQRITIIYTDVSVAHAMLLSLNLKKFNLIAGQPKTDAALAHCCTAFNGDIITFDSDAGIRLMVNRKSYKVAVQRGMFFEIKYAPVVVDTNCRKDTIKLAQNFRTKGKSKNIIISSGAKSEFQVRSPYDVANLSFIFCLNESQGKNAIDRYCRELYLKAESRRIGKTVMFMTATGPIVYAESTDEEQQTSDDDEMDAIIGGDNNDTDSDNCDNDSSPKQPKIKKKKYN